MELEAVIRDRRSIRAYQPRPVEQEKLDQIIECARLCQSAKNRQPWQLMVLQGEKKQAVAEIMLRLFDTEHPELPKYYTSSRRTAQIIQQAPVLILVFREQDDMWLTGDLLSIGAAIEHMALEAVNLGLGSLWIRDVVYTQHEIGAYVGYDQLHLTCALALGYPDEAPNPRPRKQREEILLTPKQ